MNPPHTMRVIDGHLLQITEIICSVRITLHTCFGSVARDPFALAITPSTDDVFIGGCPTLEVRRLDIYAGLMEFAPWKVERRAKPIEDVHYISCRRLSLAVEATQQRPMGDEQVVPDQAVDRVVEHRPETVMESVINETERMM